MMNKSLCNFCCRPDPPPTHTGAARILLTAPPHIGVTRFLLTAPLNVSALSALTMLSMTARMEL